MGFDEAEEFMTKLTDMVRFLIPNYGLIQPAQLLPNLLHILLAQRNTVFYIISFF